MLAESHCDDVSHQFGQKCFGENETGPAATSNMADVLDVLTLQQLTLFSLFLYFSHDQKKKREKKWRYNLPLKIKN